jgi:hypothetical protein
MNSPAQAILWQIWTRHRLGLSISAVCLVLMVVAMPPILLRFDDKATFVVTLIPAAVIFPYLANLVLFSDEVGSLTSGYPRRIYTLPAATHTLAFWPMLITVVGSVALWLVIAVLIYHRGGYRPPLLLPAVGIAVTMAWLQTICWLPIKSQLVRVYLLLIGFCVLLGAPGWLFQRELISLSSLSMLAIFELAGLFVLARLGVAHDRRGVDWSFGVDRAVEWCWSIFDRTSQQPPSFRTAREAQDWFEYHCHASMLKGVIFFLLCLDAAMYVWVPQGKTLAFRIGLGCMLGTPLIMAGSQGAALGRMRPIRSRQRGPITFLAIRPILTGDMLDAKYRMITRCVIQIWLMTLAITTTVVLVKGQAGDVLEILRSFLQLYPGWRGWTILGLAIALAPVFTWKMLTDSLAAGLTGRRWFADGIVVLGTSVLMVLIATGIWYAMHPVLLSRHIPILIWLAAVLVIMKCLLAAWAFRVAVDRGLLELRSIVRLFGLGSVVAIATLILAQLLLPAGNLGVPRPVVLLATLSSLPLARFALAPLALEWNRHR